MSYRDHSVCKDRKNMYVTPKDLVDGGGGLQFKSLRVWLSQFKYRSSLITFDYLQALYTHIILKKNWYFRQDFLITPIQLF